MNLFKQKRMILIVPLVASFFMFAQASLAIKPPSATQGLLKKDIPFDFAAGVNFQNLTARVTNVGPELLAQYISELTYFFLRLAVVLAVLMITIGGFQWLIALGNASKISNAKDTIQQALIGLTLALASYLMFSQIDKSFVELKPLDIARPGLSIDCGLFKHAASCPLQACKWLCLDNVDPQSTVEKSCKNHGDPEQTGAKGSCVAFGAGAAVNYCSGDVLATIEAKRAKRALCGFSPFEKQCIDDQSAVDPRWVCCLNTDAKLFTFAYGHCQPCNVPPKYRSSIGIRLTKFWSMKDTSDCALLPIGWQHYDAS